MSYSRCLSRARDRAEVARGLHFRPPNPTPGPTDLPGSSKSIPAHVPSGRPPLSGRNDELARSRYQTDPTGPPSKVNILRYGQTVGPVGLSRPVCQQHPLLDVAAVKAGPERGRGGPNSGSGRRRRPAEMNFANTPLRPHPHSPRSLSGAFPEPPSGTSCGAPQAAAPTARCAGRLSRSSAWEIH